MNTTLESLLENLGKTMTAIIKRVANGQELSKSVSSEEACAGMLLVSEGLADPGSGCRVSDWFACET